MPDKFEMFNEGVRSVLVAMQEEALHFKHGYLGSEHLVLALVKVERTNSHKALSGIGVTHARTRHAVEFIIGHGTASPDHQLSLTPRTRTIIHRSFDEARRLNHHYIGPEHLLLGLLSEGEGIGIGVLETLGVNCSSLQEEIKRLITEPT